MSNTQAETCVLGDKLGEGAFGAVTLAVTPSGRTVAVKRSRVSMKVQRTSLIHEARVFQLLQGHPSIPRLIGYTRGRHFEYLAMELLAAHLKSKVTAKTALKPHTVASIGRKMLSALAFLYSKGLVHCDIKPENIMISLDNDIRLIDFGLARSFPFHTAPAASMHKNRIIGTLHWCSLNIHMGIEPRPRDDLESLAYVLCFLDRGSLPWRPSDLRLERSWRDKARVKASKTEFRPETTSDTVRGACGRLLGYARNLSGSDMPSYSSLSNEWISLETRLGSGMHGLDWTTVPSVFDIKLQDWVGPSAAEADNLPVDSDSQPNEVYSDSNESIELGEWEPQHGRDTDITLSLPNVALLDSSIPIIKSIVYENDTVA